MIFSYIRKSFTHLFPSSTFFLREFHVSSSLSLLFGSNSTKSEVQPIGTPTISEILLGEAPERSKSILIFLKENGFSNNQLETMIRTKRELLSANLEKRIKPKFEIFQELGFSASQIAEVITKEPTILCCSANNRIIPSMAALSRLLGSQENLFQALKRCGWFLTENLNKKMWPNVEFLRSCGVPMEHIIWLMSRFGAYLFIRPETVRKTVEKLDRIGADPSSKMYIHAFRVVSSMSDEVWELKLQTFLDLGFSEADIRMALKKSPYFIAQSVKKIKGLVEIILATKRYTVSSIVAHPRLLSCSIYKRIKPRLQVFEYLNTRNLIKKWPSLGTVYLPDERFYERFVAPYPNEAARLNGLLLAAKGKGSF